MSYSQAFLLLISQLQLQRNEVIALMNLLNRLSESLKVVHEMGTSAEMTIKGQISAPAAQSCPLQRIWASIVGTKEGQSSAPTSQGCPLQRMWASIVGSRYGITDVHDVIFFFQYLIFLSFFFLFLFLIDDANKREVVEMWCLAACR